MNLPEGKVYICSGPAIPVLLKQLPQLLVHLITASSLLTQYSSWSLPKKSLCKISKSWLVVNIKAVPFNHLEQGHPVSTPHPGRLHCIRVFIVFNTYRMSRVTPNFFSPPSQMPDQMCLDWLMDWREREMYNKKHCRYNWALKKDLKKAHWQCTDLILDTVEEEDNSKHFWGYKYNYRR